MDDPKDVFAHELGDVLYVEGSLAKTRPPRGFDGIRAEHDEFVADRRVSSAMLDLHLTGAAARNEHYEIAAHTGLVTMADALGEKGAATLLRKNLRQEQAALKRVTDIATKLAARPESAGHP